MVLVLVPQLLISWLPHAKVPCSLSRASSPHGALLQAASKPCLYRTKHPGIPALSGNRSAQPAQPPTVVSNWMLHCGALWLNTVRLRPLMPAVRALAPIVACLALALSGMPLTRPTCRQAGQGSRGAPSHTARGHIYIGSRGSRGTP